MVFDVLTLIGGLCLFMFGMNLMGHSLERAAGNKLQSLLAKFTTGKAAGFFTGLTITAIIQSSSATTVMVVGFVNSGLMNLRQAINVIMGANVGTTITSWILSLAGIEGGIWYTDIFKPATWVPVLALIGLILYLAGKTNRKRDVGTILLGFATLMFGMDIMSDAAKSFKGIVSEVFGFFGNDSLGFFAPVLAVLAGVIFTAILQSSSASVGVLQALTGSGSGITNSVAFPIIMGQNIGTCVTALLSSAGANKNGKRAAIVHLIFNLIGTVIMLMIFYIVRGAIPAFAYDASKFSIAIMHTIFNVGATIIMLPSARLLEKIAYKLVKDDEKTQEEPLLDERLLSAPAIALGVCHDAVTTLANISVEALKLANDCIINFSEKTVKRVREIEERTDHYEDHLGTYLVKLSSNQIGDHDANEAAKYLKIISDYERISDHAVNIIRSSEELEEKGLEFTDTAKSELGKICSAVNEILDSTLFVFVNNDIKAAYQIEPLEQVIDKLRARLRSNHITRLQKNACSIEVGFIWNDILTNLERVSDHCSNIAGSVIDSHNNNMNIHETLRTFKYDDPEFKTMYEAFLDKYYIANEQ